MQPRNSDRINAYIQGSVWMWQQNDLKKSELKRGVQSSGRPVLIISNNTFNQFSPSVNCLAITSSLKDSPVHVLFTLDVESHILCEQTHTISKNELTEYKGVVSPLTLANVKAKLSLQYDMPTDRSLEILTNISNSVNLLNEKAINGFGVTTIADEMAATLIKIYESFYYIKKEIANLQAAQNIKPTADAQDDAPFDEISGEHMDKPDSAEIAGDKRKHGRAGYTDADIAFITDSSNSIDSVIAKFGLKDKPTAYRMRSYYKRKLNNSRNLRQAEPGNTAEQAKPKVKTKPRGKHRTYTEEEKQYILDTANPIEDIVEMFGYKDKATAYKMRSYFKKRLSAIGTVQDQMSSDKTAV